MREKIRLEDVLGNKNKLFVINTRFILESATFPKVKNPQILQSLKLVLRVVEVF